MYLYSVSYGILHVFLRTKCVLPVYIFKFQIYQLSESARHQAFIPHLVGLLGIYCIHESLPL